MQLFTFLPRFLWKDWHNFYICQQILASSYLSLVSRRGQNSKPGFAQRSQFSSTSNYIQRSLIKTSLLNMTSRSLHWSHSPQGEIQGSCSAWLRNHLKDHSINHLYFIRNILNLETKIKKIYWSFKKTKNIACGC